MKRSKIISLILSIVMLAGIFPMNTSAEETDPTMRTVYLHAQGKNPSLEPINSTTVYVNEDTDVYFAVDDPNKGKYLDDDHEDVVDAKAEAKAKAEAEADKNGLTGEEREAYINYAVNAATEIAKHSEPRYDMNGYRLRICFDPDYFKFADEGAASPIDYTVPDENFKTSETEDVNKGDDNTVLGDESGGGNSIEDVPQSIGYFVYRPTGTGEYTLAGKTYKTAYITVFYNGGFAPQKTAEQNWYNLAKLTLTPIKAGSTNVFIDTDSGDEDYMLELFAKNETDEINDQTFDFNAINGGYHHFLIKDRTKPTPPVANPPEGEYNEKYRPSVVLTQEENLTIYYTTNGDDPSDPSSSRQAYEEPIDIEVDTLIRACAYRSGGEDGEEGKYSSVRDYQYTIIPDRPYLFDNSADKKLLPDRNEFAGKTDVYVSDKDVYGRIADGSEVYYTFGNLDAKDPVIGDDPETTWVKVEKKNQLTDNQLIHIDKNRTVRLITNKLGRYSEPAVYYFTIKPKAPEADYDSGEYDRKIDVSLSTETEGATIYYTTDGSDPKINGIEYAGIPIPLYKDTTLRAISYFDGGWSDRVSYYYLFSFYDDFGVDAFYPPGVYEGSVNVTLTPNNPDYVVKYRIGDGEWKDYTEVIEIDTDTEIIAKAVELKSDGSVKAEGDEYVFIYKIKPMPPEFAPESTQFTNANKITIYTPESTEDTTDRFKLYYTLDGSDPITSGTRILADGKSDSAVISIEKYTVVTAVVLKDDESWSNVVKHSYDIVTLKPVKPLTTLLPGHYTHKIGGEGYSTQFMPVSQGTVIYYTISYDGGLCPDPVPDTEGTYLYDSEASPSVSIKGNTVIKAVAVNAFGIKSDVGIFSYTITPEVPKAAPSATIGGDTLPVVPVDAVKGSTVKYKIGDFENSFVNEDDERFYIDTKTGGAYRDKECTERLGKESSASNSGSVTLEISAELDGVESDTNRYVYAASGGDDIAPPYADKETGTYEEIKIDNNNNILKVRAYSLNSGGKIQYRIDDSGGWIDYTDDSGILLKDDTVLQLRYAKGGSYSSVASYVYNFVPLAPVITLPSGTYLKSDDIETKIAYDERIPDKNYNIFYRRNGDPKDYKYNFSPMTPQDLEIDHTMTIKAYVLNEDTGRVSKNTIHYYIIESGSGASGSVYIAYPYDTDRISAHKIGTGDYAEGIKLLSQNKTADIHYYYRYTKTDGTVVETNVAVYDIARPIMPTILMDNITIVAWLEDKNGKIANSDGEFNIDFVHLGIPVTSLEESGKIEFPKGTEYTLINDYPNDKNIILYYTIDGSDPSDADNKNRIVYKGEELVLNSAATIKAVYFSACGKCKDIDDVSDCHNCVYGDIGVYRYTVPTISDDGDGYSGGHSGGSYRGGTTTVDNTRKYTRDIFGNEHPTHIKYINGYPDGSVRPEGDITREEVTAILYRVTNHEYEEPFVATGDAFPDVEAGRWSAHDIEYMADKEIVTGYPDGEFKPSRNLSRAEFATLICRFAKISEADIENPFTDLEENHWAYKEILALADSGLIEGYPDKTYKPENYITRAEVMTVVNKLLGRKPLKSYVESLHFNPYNDLYEEKWYYVTVLEATITHNYWLDGAGYEYRWEDWK